MNKCAVCKNDKKRSWLYYGLITGFLIGFTYFAFGVYDNLHNSNHKKSSNHTNNDGSTK